MICPRCDGQRQLIAKNFIVEWIYIGHGDIHEYEEECDILEPCPDCYNPDEGIVDYD